MQFQTTHKSNPRATYPRETFNHLLEPLGRILHLHNLKMAFVAEGMIGRNRNGDRRGAFW